MAGNEKAPAQGPAEARDYSHSYLIKLRRGEQAEVAQLTRIHRLAVLINHRCVDQEVEIRISKGKTEVTLYEIQQPYGPVRFLRKFGNSHGQSYPNGNLDEAQRWLEGITETIFKEEIKK